MRIPIREQLTLLLLLASLIGLGVISIAVWVSTHSFVLNLRSSRLALTASLKAAQMASNINLMQTTSSFIATRIVIQQALLQYNLHGNNTKENWAEATTDMYAALGDGQSQGQAFFLQSIIFPKNASGPAGHAGLLNTTNAALLGKLELPAVCPNGARVTLGMNASQCGGLSYGYPPALYPNLTYSTTFHGNEEIQQAEYDGVVIGPYAQPAIFLGPWRVNNTFSIVSITMPEVNNTSYNDVLGWLTVVMDAKLIQQVVNSGQGLDNTGETLVVGPENRTNLFPNGILYSTNHGNPPQNFPVRYVETLHGSEASRHPNHTIGTANPPFDASKYPAILQGLTERTGQMDNSGAKIRGHNEAGFQVSSGYAIPQTELVDWLIIVEQERSEVWQPINHLRVILLACLFGTAGFMAIVAFPLAHFASLPIRRLREATAKSVEPPGQSASRSSFDSLDFDHERSPDGTEDAVDTGEVAVLAKKEGSKNPVTNWRQKRTHERAVRREARRRQAFRIPGKVKERKHIVKDELSDLTTTFNEMSDELMMQYTKLEERVYQRTLELEQSKKAAEAANESKTLFIANISHELKTPLNGILGMCAVCMQEDDPVRLKRSLGIIYKSGDLLLNLLTDLLTFSKNQVGQQLSLDEKEFRLRDVSSQVLAIFDKQARERVINFRVEWEGVQNLPSDNSSPERTENGPNGTGRLKDMILWGDLQRVLQVVINLVSNALKFTPSGGSVVLIIRCLPEVTDTGSRKTSMASRQSRQLSSRHKSSDATLAGAKIDTANSINARDKPNALYSQERAASPPPGIFLHFEFEVTDTGPGIPEHLLDKIFEPFVQADLGLSKKYGGTGLGLSICSQLASLMRGSMSVQSTVGSGSTFRMSIPLRHLKTRAGSSTSSTVDLGQENEAHRAVSLDETDKVPARHSRAAAEETTKDDTSLRSGHATQPPLATESQPRLVGLSTPYFAASEPMESPGSQPAAMQKIADEATRSGNRIRVLVAEDNKVNQEVVLRMLKLEDIYDVTVAKDGQEALDLVKESMTPATPGGSGDDRKPYNLIFMDVQMPNVDGLQSTRLIREIGYQAPIVALTAFAEESNIKDCYESGMNYFLSKPIRRPQLKKVLKEYCAPIPEENEEPSPTEEAKKAESQTTTIVMMNGPGNEAQAQLQQATGQLFEAATASKLPPSSEPVSPLTTA